MNNNYKMIFVSLLMASSLASVAALCPPSSCNPHNGCTEGCSIYNTQGVSSCDFENPKNAEKKAVLEGITLASKSCSYGYFLTTDWKITEIKTSDDCKIQAQAQFSCFQ